MKLNEKIEEELKDAIKTATKNGASFPVEFKTRGNINHKISVEKEASSHLITVLEVDGKDYMIYLIK
jgi:tRNA(Ser,Leu) C12 N-acetylase TAN1